MGLKGIIIATVLVFSLSVYMVAAAPAITNVYDSTADSDAVEDQGFSGQMALVKNTALIFVPTMFIVGIVLYAYAAIQKEESFFGSGGAPR